MPVSVERFAFIQKEYRQTPPLEDPSVKTKDPLATELTFSTPFVNLADAVEFQEQALDLRRIGRFDWQLSIRRELATFEIGSTIRISYPRYNLQNGGDFIVKRLRHDHSSPFSQLTLYGPRS